MGNTAQSLNYFTECSELDASHIGTLVHLGQLEKALSIDPHNIQVNIYC